MIRVATAALSKRIFAGHPLKSGLGFREPRHDVTNDVYGAIKDHVGIGYQIELRRDGEPGFIIAILPLPAENDAGVGAISDDGNLPPDAIPDSISATPHDGSREGGASRTNSADARCDATAGDGSRKSDGCEP